MKYRMIDAHQCEKDGFYTILTIETIPNLIERLFTKPRTLEFRGACTVWRRLPSMRRCSTSMESMLTDFLEKARYDGKVK